MKRTFKKLAVLASMVIMMAVTTISAYAAESRNDGTWKQNQTGWWYEFVDGSYLTNGWYWIDGNHDEVYECYYFDNNGYMAANTTIGSDMVNDNGAWVVNGVVQTKKIESTEVSTEDVKLPRETATQQNDEIERLETYNDYTRKQAEEILSMMDESTSTSTFGGTFIFK